MIGAEKENMYLEVRYKGLPNMTAWMYLEWLESSIPTLIESRILELK